MTPCTKCATPTDRTLAGVPTCPVCKETVIGPIRARRNADGRPDGFNGTGRPQRDRSDHLPGMYDLQCDTCDAEWVGRTGEACGWCDRRYGHLLDEQRHLVLNPELPDPDDQRYDAAVAAWAERLAVAVKADVITADEARRALGDTRQEAAA